MQLLHSSIVDTVIVQAQHKSKYGSRDAIRRPLRVKRKTNVMAYTTQNRTMTLTLAERFSALRARITEAAAQRKVYRTTLSELEALTSRELADLGINRSMIKSIALEAAYNK